MTELAMKVVLAFALFLTLSATAHAKLAPVEEMPRSTPPSDDSAVLVGPAGAMLEADYFRAPQKPAPDPHMCRLQLRVFEKTQLAESCH
jgi:hypothetical protein